MSYFDTAFASAPMNAHDDVRPELTRAAPTSLALSASAGGGGGGTSASQGRRPFDPLGDFNFHIEIEGIGAGSFQKIDGLDLEIDTIEFKDSLDFHPHKRKGVHRFGNIKLTKGVIENAELWEWCTRMMAGELDRRNGTIKIYNDAGNKDEPEALFNFFAAWPCKWSGLRIDGKGGAILVEELELAIDYFDRG